MTLGRWGKLSIRRARHIRFLRSVGTDRVEHSEERLLDHLISTHDLLASWGARPALCEGALFHSIYGTQFLDAEVLGSGDRNKVRARIGDEAEELAWLWHSVRRDSIAANLEREDGLRIETQDDAVIAINRQQFHDLVNLWVADAVEQLPRRDSASVERQRAWLTPLLPVALPAGAEAARKIVDRAAG